MPSVSFIIPSHNRAAELAQTLESLVAQTREDWEAIVVDDHSTDGALDLARGFAELDGRFRVIQLPDPHRGAPAGRNLAMTLARGEFIIFLDGDDLVAPACVEQRVAHLQRHRELDFVVWNCQLFRKQPGDVPVLFNIDTGIDALNRYLAMDVPWQTMQPIWRRSTLARLALSRTEANSTPQIWDESVLSGQDWEFHIRALAIGLKHARVETIDCFWRMANDDRDSIGKQSFTKQHALARPAVVRKMHDFVLAQNAMTPERRSLFAALYFQTADTLARRVSRKEGRRVWREALTLKLIDRRHWREMDRQLFLQRWPSLAARAMRDIEYTWPRELLPRSAKFFCLAPLPGHTPRVSVVMSAYNNAPYIRQAITSILDQTFRDLELIVIDDGSKDETGLILRDLAARDCRIHLIQRENKGLTVSLNEGLSLARGEYIARMDTDDVAHRTRLAEQVAYLDAHPDVVLLGTKVMLIDPAGVELIDGEHHTGHATLDAQLLKGNGAAIYHPSVLMRRAAVERVGRYKVKYNGAEDIDLFLRLAEIGRIENLSTRLLDYRRHPASVNHTKHEQQWKLVGDVVDEARARRGLPPIDRNEIRKWTPEPVPVMLRNWAWNALKRGQRSVARSHAWRAVRGAPTSVDNWRVLACAIRGH